MRIILHIDMDYFFAQVEERENPWLKEKSVVIGADPKEGKGRGVVSTCNYNARKYGIKSGMPISRAYKLNPEAVFLSVNMKLYKKTSVNIFSIIKKKVKKMEKVSLDEAYVDLTEKAGNFKNAKKIGEEIKNNIFKEEKLTCTIGIAENKMIAKIACESVKPKGIKIVYPSNSKKFISDLKIEKIPGIGPKTRKVFEDYLNKKNLKIKNLRKITKEDLESLLGKKGIDFYYKFQGIDNSPVEEKKEVKSIGKEYTFQKDTRDPEKITKVFKRLVSAVSLRAEKTKIKGVVVVCRFEDFETHTKQISFNPDYYNRDFFYKKSIPLLLQFLVQNNKKIRLIGFRVVAKIK